MICKLCGNQYNAPKCSFCGLAPNENPVVTALYFGKHKGETIEQVFYREPGYLQWMLRENVGTPAQRAFARVMLARRNQSNQSGFEFNYTFAAVALLIVGAVFLVWLYFNVVRHSAVIPTQNVAPAAVATPTPTAQQLSAKGELLYSAPGCVIKGNVAFNNPEEKIYHLPGGKYYDATKIDTRYGERWFCTEADAVNNGWRKSKE